MLHRFVSSYRRSSKIVRTASRSARISLVDREMKRAAAIVIAVVVVIAQRESRAAPSACGALTTRAVPMATITQAETVAAGTFVPPGGPAGGDAFRSLPAFCRVAATLNPSADSDIKIEVWLPAVGWNGKYQAVGNGAFSGTINYGAMREALARGYATSSTDTGHTGGGAAWALGHPEKVVDFGWRAVHEMAVTSKQVVAKQYGRPAARSYWKGCSAGGRQAMKAAQRFPADFDGVIAGAPGLDWTSRAARAVQLAQRLEANPAARVLQAHRELLHAAVVKACDALDGVQDGVLEDPGRCTFDPSALACA